MAPSTCAAATERRALRVLKWLPNCPGSRLRGLQVPPAPGLSGVGVLLGAAARKSLVQLSPETPESFSGGEWRPYMLCSSDGLRG